MHAATGTGCRLRTLWIGWCIGCSLLLGGCSDGYPAGELDFELGAETTLDEALQVMNHLGKQVGSDAPKQFALEAGCTLLIETGSFWRKQAQQVPLVSGKARIEATEEERLFDVVLAPRKDTGTGHHVLLEAAPFFDAHQMSWLVNHVQHLCGTDQAGHS